VSDDRLIETSRGLTTYLAGPQSRRQFLRRAGTALVATGAVSSLLAACGGSSSVEEVKPTSAASTAASGSSGSASTATSSSGSGTPAASGSGTPAANVGNVATGPDVAERRIRKLIVLTEPQANVPQEYETTNLMVNLWKQLGIDVEMKVIPWEQMSDVVWYNRDKWDITAWQMVGRPERLDPDEFLYNLFHSSTAEKG
jgi:hypothetical protein